MQATKVITSTVKFIDEDGEVTDYTYTLPPREAIITAVNQIAFNIGLQQNYKPVDLIETEISLVYPFRENLAFWVRK